MNLNLYKKIPKNRVPLLPLLSAPGIKLTKTSLFENLSNYEIQTRTLLAILEKFQPDGIFTFMDLSVEAETLGLKIYIPDNNSPPSIKNHPVKNISLLNEIKSISQEYKGEKDLTDLP
jgi:uroporphyrinogen decarboxylase